MNLHCITVK